MRADCSYYDGDNAAHHGPIPVLDAGKCVPTNTGAGDGENRIAVISDF